MGPTYTREQEGSQQELERTQALDWKPALLLTHGRAWTVPPSHLRSFAPEVLMALLGSGLAPCWAPSRYQRLGHVFPCSGCHTLPNIYLVSFFTGGLGQKNPQGGSRNLNSLPQQLTLMVLSHF